ncbi:hypothetical protein [Periweissella fabalis]|uniref:Uncharacterized protein n=1 Tax=Periweissella fabalis TaxID=1070421 RepID=A0A7X6S345_9LACO|nr:hypothetical protein [Periweissella fabalis]MCM0599303.1 hypothetical protein [Periweissella fabalis]NKZ23582.1 hypothetical protein [Periweissella fabalis]
MKTYQYTHLLPILKHAIQDNDIKAITNIYQNIEQLQQAILANENGQTAHQIEKLRKVIVLYILQNHNSYPDSLQPLINALRQLEHPDM